MNLPDSVIFGFTAQKCHKWETCVASRYIWSGQSTLKNSVQFSYSVTSDSATPGLPVHHQLLEYTQTYVHWVGDAIQPSHPLSSPSPPLFNLSQNQGLFHWVSSLHQMAKGLELQLQHQSFQWIFRTDFLYDGMVGSPCIQGTLKSLLQHRSSKASILRHSAFFLVQLSHPHMTTGKTIALTRQTFVGKVISLLFNMLFRLVRHQNNFPLTRWPGGPMSPTAPGGPLWPGSPINPLSPFMPSTGLPGGPGGPGMPEFTKSLSVLPLRELCRFCYCPSEWRANPAPYLALPGTRHEAGTLLLDDRLLEQNQCLTQYLTHSRGSVSTGEWMPLSFPGSWTWYLLIFLSFFLIYIFLMWTIF